METPKSLDAALAEFMERAESGRGIDREEFLARHAEHRQALLDFMHMHEQFSAAGDSIKDSGNSAPSQSASDHAPPSQQQGCDTAEGDGSVTDAGIALTPASSIGSSPPRYFGAYEILEEIDRGGMGVVYKARHQELGRTVALKVIRSGELASDDEVQRFRSEAEAAAALTHPGIVPIYEVGVIDRLVYYTMAYIDGVSLAQATCDELMDPMDAARIVVQLCAAVTHAHKAGVLHRDIKPANVLIDKQGQPILIDFGLAKIVNQDAGLTATGQILGTPAYMAPEHASGHAIQPTPCSDVYSLGAILYFLCAGQPPFTGPTPFDVLMQVLDREPPPPSKVRRGVSHELDFVCQRALHKAPKLRYSSAEALAQDLKKLLRGQPLDCPLPTVAGRLHSWWRREPILVVHLCGIGLTTAIVAGWHYWRGAEPTREFPVRMVLLFSWIAASYFLQLWVIKARWRDLACLTWATVDVTIYTSLLAFADEPRSMLLIGYPMMVVASSLFYRARFVLFTTGVCIAGFILLAVFAPMQDFVKKDFATIFVVGLGVICMTLLSTIRRIRRMSLFIDE